MTMNALTSTVTGCGSSACGCAGSAAAPASAASSADVARINGVALHAPGRRPDDASLRERAWAELLRQEAVRQGLLPASPATEAPELTEADRRVIESMTDAAVTVPEPTEEECRRHYDGHPETFTVGQAVHLRHILFAVTPGVNVHALTVRAEQALLELSRKDVSAGRFAELAAELSNCPSGAQGGDLGWVGPDECAPELANELFHQKHSRWGMGVHPRLVHTRFGFHIVEVLGRRKGRVPPFESVRDRIAAQWVLQSRARGLNQYMRLLVAAARIEGLDLEGADSPLVQ